MARRLATLAAAPTASVVVRGALAAARALDAAAADPAVLADVHAECARYGAVERVALAAGDVVVCPSEMEHRVGAVSSGTRASLNVDFWDVDAADDRRSDFDRY